MKVLREFIREAVGRDPFGYSPGELRTTFTPYGQTESRIVSGAFTGAGSFLKAGAALMTSPRKGGGMQAAWSKGGGTKGLAAFGLFGTVTYGILSYFNKDGNSDISEEESAAAERYLDEFQSGLITILENKKSELISQTRFPDIRDLPSGQSIEDGDEMITKMSSHYDLIAQKICSATSYDAFFSNDSYGAKVIQNQVSELIDGKLPKTTTDPKIIGDTRTSLKSWAHAVLINYTVHNIIYQSLTSDISALEKAASTVTYTQQQDIKSIADNISRKIQACQNYVDSKKVLVDAGYSAS